VVGGLWGWGYLPSYPIIGHRMIKDTLGFSIGYFGNESGGCSQFVS
jgi:hypothetical protein